MFITRKNKKWWVLVAMTGSLSMILLDSTIVGVCLPTIQYHLSMSNSGLEWVMNAYVLAIASLVAVGGSLGDIIGRKKTFIIGTIIFALTSAFCGIAFNGTFLIISRVLQGIGASLMIPASAAIVATSFELEERGRAMSIYAGISTIFMALGPLIGGFLSQYFSWRWCFYINLPVAVTSITLTLISSPKEHIVRGQKFDFQGAATFIIGAVCLVFGFQEATNLGWDSLLTIGLILLGIVMLLFFIRLEEKKEFPLIDLRLFKYDNFAVDFFILFFLSLAMIGQIFFNMIYVQNVLGFTPLYAGLISMFTIIPLATVVHISGRLLDKVGVRKPVIFGLSLVLLSYIIASLVIPFQNIYFILPYMILLGAGIGFAMAPSQADALNRVPWTLRGQAAGLTHTSRRMGSTLGLALLSTIFNYSDKMRIESIMSSLSVDPKYYYTIMKTLSMPEIFRVKALHGIIAEDKISILVFKLKAAMSISISLAYGLGTLSAVVALIIAVKKLKKGKQESEIKYHNIAH
jgi:EmrB/QacA subfamily drug resistance transporter